MVYDTLYDNQCRAVIIHHYTSDPRENSQKYTTIPKKSSPGFPTGFFSGGALFLNGRTFKIKSAPPRGGTFWPRWGGTKNPTPKNHRAQKSYKINKLRNLWHHHTPARDLKRKSPIQRAGFTLKAETWYPHNRDFGLDNIKNKAILEFSIKMEAGG